MHEKMEYVKSVIEDGAPLISVIVPVYNVEDYLEQCLKSICVQTMSRIEVIVIDDGSTDSSGQICDAFASEDQRIRVRHKKNEGLAAARNDGLMLARAEYIMFVDSDDWVEPDFCETPYRLAVEKGADLVTFGILRVNRRGRSVGVISPPAEGFISKEEALIKYWPIVRVVAWNKMYRRNLFEGVWYPVGSLCEDAAVMHRVIQKSERTLLLDKVLYNYRERRSGSITEVKSKQLLEDSTRYRLQRLDDLRAWGYDCREEEQRVAITFLAQYGRHHEKSSDFEKILRECRHFTKSTSWRQKVMFQVYRISPVIFDWVSVLTRRRYRE